MNITCDSCQARYTISDEKVTGEGRVFKVQCKQCDAEIVVEGISEAAATPADPTVQPSAPWYYAVGQDRQGPVSREQIAELIAAGTLSDSTYVWCDGMEDWSGLGDVEALKDLLGPAESVASEPTTAPAPATEEAPAEAAPAASTEAAIEEAAPPAEDLFSFDATEKAPRTSVHGRRDSSVLFSLDELSSFEEPREQDPQSFLTETSGLIDIRGLANSHQAQADDAADNPFLSATGGGASSSKPSFSLSYVPVVARKRSPWPWIAGVAAVLVIGIGVTWAVVGGDDGKSGSGERDESAESVDKPESSTDDSQRQAESVSEPSTAPVPSPKVVAGGDDTPKQPGVEKTDQVDEKKAPAEEPPPAVDDKKKTVSAVAKPPVARRVPAKTTRLTPRKAAPKVTAAKPAVVKSPVPPKVEPPKPPKEDKKSTSKGVNDLLVSLSGKKAKKTPTGGTGGTGPKTLTSSTVRSKVGSRKSRFKSCYKMQPNRAATGVNVTLKFTIKNTGSIGAARVNGGGLTGGVQSCILRALKSIRFPVFRDPEKKVTYPLFLL